MWENVFCFEISDFDRRLINMKLTRAVSSIIGFWPQNYLMRLKRVRSFTCLVLLMAINWWKLTENSHVLKKGREIPKLEENSKFFIYLLKIYSIDSDYAEIILHWNENLEVRFVITSLDNKKWQNEKKKKLKYSILSSYFNQIQVHIAQYFMSPVLNKIRNTTNARYRANFTRRKLILRHHKNT